MPDDGATRDALVASLHGQRAHVLGILEGLDNHQLRTAQLPSGWTPVGLVQHLALDVERYWFTCIVGGAPLESADADSDAWTVAAHVPAQVVLERYREEAAAADEVIAATDLDAPPAQRDEWWGTWEVPNLRFVLLHVIAETACHAGHLDAARELTDGRQWLRL
jgi:hypothetical protein